MTTRPDRRARARPLTSRARYRAYLANAARLTNLIDEPIDATGKRPERHRLQRPFLALLGDFLRLLRGQRLMLALCLLTLTASVGLGLLLPFSTKIALDYILTDNPGPAGIPPDLGLPTDRVALLQLVAASMVAIAAVNLALGLWGRWQVTRITKRVQVRLRRRAFEHAARLPLHRVQQLKSGGLVSMLREDAGQAPELIFSMIYNPWRALVQLAGTLIVLAWVDWRMVVGGVLLIPATWVTHRTWIARLRPVYRDIRMSRTHMDAHSTEVFGGMRVVRGFARVPAESSRFVRNNNFMGRQEFRAWWWSRILEGIWSIFIPAASAALLLYGGSRVVNGQMSIGDLMMFSAYLLMLLGPLETLTSTATNIQSNLAGLDRTLELLREKREFADTPGRIRLARPGVRGRIELRDVHFAYPKPPAPRAGSPEPDAPPPPIIRGASITIEPGTTLALVGPSGSGKTTLCNLIARFHDPDSGAVLLDGTDLRDIDVHSYRRLLGIVEQDVFLFDGTIADNIAYARPDAPEPDIIAAARAADAHDFIVKLESGYDALVGERGVRLSGGQKQRLAIARAILADPAILILDEATSSLDSESEALIQRSLARLMQRRTCVVIAHRLSTIRNADLIAVVQDGRIVETGTHDQLLSRGGRYSELLRAQIAGFDQSAAHA